MYTLYTNHNIYKGYNHYRNMVVKTSISISIKLRDFLDEHSTRRGQTYEDVIWMLIGNKEITKENKKQLPSEYEDKLNTKKKKR